MTVEKELNSCVYLHKRQFAAVLNSVGTPMLIRLSLAPSLRIACSVYWALVLPPSCGCGCTAAAWPPAPPPCWPWAPTTGTTSSATWGRSLAPPLRSTSPRSEADGVWGMGLDNACPLIATRGGADSKCRWWFAAVQGVLLVMSLQQTHWRCSVPHAAISTATPSHVYALPPLCVHVSP